MFKTISEVRAANRRIDNHFFDRDTMRFFKSKIESGVYGGRYFITSEQFREDSSRRYTIREAKASGEVNTIGAFQAYYSLEDARQNARELVKQLEYDVLTQVYSAPVAV